MRQAIEIVILAALLIVLSVLPGYAQERSGAAPTGATVPTDAPRVDRAAYIRFDGIDGESDDGGGGGGGGSAPHCWEDEDLQMSICE